MLHGLGMPCLIAQESPAALAGSAPPLIGTNVGNTVRQVSSRSWLERGKSKKLLDTDGTLHPSAELCKEPTQPTNHRYAGPANTGAVSSTRHHSLRPYVG